MGVSAIEAKFFILAALAISLATAHSSEERCEHECANKFYRYRLDREPAEYGISAGHYAPGKKAFVGIGSWQFASLNSGRIQLHPPGIQLVNPGGPASFTNDSSQIWYLYRNKRHTYKWVDSQNGEIVPFAIDFNSDAGGFSMNFGRMKRNDTVLIGVMPAFMGAFYYVDESGNSRTTKTGYQVLTCRTKRKEKKIPPPAIPPPPPSMVSTGPSCSHTWLPFNNDNAPALNGVSAGEHECGNVAYIGKAKSFGLFQPGRIQTSPAAGFFTISGGKEIAVTNGSFYLADNENYTYRWVPSTGDILTNMVTVEQDTGRFALPIARVKINGRVKIGKGLQPVATFPGENGIEASFYNFEQLVCDPWPKFQCSQQWNAFDASQLATYGLSVDGGVTFVGRGTCKCINNGCDFGVGAATASDGVTFLDDLTATPVNSNNDESDISPEYLVRDAQNTYKWAVSSDGMQVANAIELHSEGHAPFYIGTTRVDDRVYVGKVRPGQGLFFVDAEGRQRTTNAYSVLTCFSPDASNGVWEKKSDASWLNEHWCPVGKEWNFEHMKCEMSEEMNGIIG